MGTGFPLGVMKMCRNLIVVMVTLCREHTKNHQTVHFKMVNFMVCKLYLNLKYTVKFLILRLVCRFYAISVKVPAGFFGVETDKLILEFKWKCSGHRIAKTTLKMKGEGGGLTPPDFKPCKATVIKTV